MQLGNPYDRLHEAVGANELRKTGQKHSHDIGMPEAVVLRTKGQATRWTAGKNM